MKSAAVLPYLDLHPEVADALAAGRPVVALESTLIAHGMPYPRNVATALQVEAQVRAGGAVPATVAVIGGRLKAGLTPDLIERLGHAGPAVAKVSRRDLPFIVGAANAQPAAGAAMGATTVAATMIVAAMAGIRVFATGGIGGVHRGAAQSFDISADLQELARTPVAVVCAGAKSVLDLGLTLEYLETHGVPVIGHRSDRFPAFYLRDSGFGVDRRLDDAAAIARAMHVQWSLGLPGGLVVANPIAEAFALPNATIDAAIDQALADQRREGIVGQRSTPYLLRRVAELTGGESLEANIALVLANARLAAAIAGEYLRLGLLRELTDGA